MKSKVTEQKLCEMVLSTESKSIIEKLLHGNKPGPLTGLQKYDYFTKLLLGRSRPSEKKLKLKLQKWPLAVE